MRPKKVSSHINLNLNIRGLQPSATLAINEQCRQMILEGKEVFRFGLGQSPFPVPDSVVESLKNNAHQKDYLPVKGLPQLREAVANHNFRHEKIKINPDNVLIGPGSKELIFILQMVYYGDLIIPTPSWVSYSPQAQIIGRHVHWATTSQNNFWRLSYEELDALCCKDPERPRIVILNYPSNPTGYTYPIERLKMLAQVARKYKIILVSDEIYGLLHHQGKHASIARFYPEGTIISSGLSKWCGAGGWRLGAFSFPPELKWLMDAMAVFASETFTSTAAPIQYAAVTAFNGNEEIDNYIWHSQRILRIIAKYLTTQIRNMGIEMETPHGAFYAFPNFERYKERLAIKGITTSKMFCQKLLEDTGVALLPGEDFGRKPEEMTARLAYVDFDGKLALANSMKTPHEEHLTDKFVIDSCPKIVKGLDKLGQWLKEL